MASFKYKTDKVKYLNIVKTLDETHQKIASEFQENRSNLPDKMSKLNELKKELDKLNKKEIEITDDMIRYKSNLKEEIKKYESEIKNIKNGKDEIEYYTKTSEILMDYYNLLDHDEEKNIDAINIHLDTDNKQDDIIDNKNEKLLAINKISQSKRKEKKPTKKRIKNLEDINKNNSKNILTFFSKNNIQKEDIDEGTETTEINNDDQYTEQPVNIVEKLVSNRASLFESYMSIIDSKYASDKIKPNYIKTCTNCNIEKTLIQSEGLYVCTQCGEVEHVIIESEIPNHKDAGNEKPRTPYKKQTHLAETLNQFQAKESTEIPNKIYSGIILELKKMKISNDELVDMKYSKAKILIKQILKKLRFTNYYEHIPFILSKITNKPAPTISRETEEIIKKMFKQTEEPFARHCPKDRKNFLNYSYVFHKFFEILDMPEYADCFSLLKSREKLKKADDAWEKICKELNWTFYPSV